MTSDLTLKGKAMSDYLACAQHAQTVKNKERPLISWLVHRESDATQAIPWEKPKYMAKANYMAKVRVSGICHWMAFASVLWQNPGRLQKVTSMGFVMEWLLPYNKHNRFSQLYIAFFNIISEMKHQINCKRLQIFSKYTHHVL